MILIRKPIGWRLRIVLGVLSVALLLGGYTWMSHVRRAVNPTDTTIPVWSEFGVALKEMCTVDADALELWELSSSTFYPEQFVDLPLLARKLQQPVRSVDIWLSNRLSPDTRAALANYEGSGSGSEQLRESLSQDFNTILHDESSISDAQRFAEVVRRVDTERLRSQAPQGAKLMHLNRLLLEDAYPMELSKFPNGKDCPEALLWVDAKATLVRLLTGLLIAVLASLVLGLLMGCSRIAEAFLLPPLAFLAKVPPTAILPIFFVVVGTDLKYFLAVIAFGVIPSMSQSIWLACQEIQAEYFHKAFTLGASNWAAMRRVMFPFVKPKMLDAIRLALGPAVVYLIAAEWLVSQDGTGFGYTIRVVGPKVNWAVPYLYVALLATFTFSVDYGLKYLQKKMCCWYARQEG